MAFYMVIERFRPGMKRAVYERYSERGRMLPEGLEYLDSWLEECGDRCYQLMKTDRRELLLEWIERWADLVEFEIVPVKASPTQQGSVDSGTGFEHG